MEFKKLSPFSVSLKYNSKDTDELKIMELNINYDTTTTADIWRENIYLPSSNDYCIYNDSGPTTSS